MIIAITGIQGHQYMCNSQLHMPYTQNFYSTVLANTS